MAETWEEGKFPKGGGEIVGVSHEDHCRDNTYGG